jgi:Cys-tRNA(Pro)/Cys-tRNA(Cys) deacylase
VPKKKPGAAGGTPATVALTRAGVAFTLHEYVHDPRAESYGLEAATVLGERLGIDPARVFKTLMATVDPSTGSGHRGALTVAVVPVAGRLDLKALARACGGSRAALAEVAAAERATGYVAGGISPIGQKRRHPTVVDETALGHDSVFVSAGRRGLDLEVAPVDLVQVTGATMAAISRS